MPPSGDISSRPASPRRCHGCIAARRLIYSARGAGKPHREAGRRLDASRQYRRRANPGQRQRHRVRSAKAYRQVGAGIGLDPCQSDIGPSLDHANGRKARSGLRRPQGRDLPRDISGLHPRVFDLGQATARERGERQCETDGSREPVAQIGFLENREAVADRSHPVPSEAFHDPRVIRRSAKARSPRVHEPRHAGAAHHAVSRAKLPSSEVELY